MKYIGSIIMWGVVVPFLVLAIMAAVFYATWSYMNGEVKARQIRYEGYLANTKRIKELTPKVRARMWELLYLREVLLSEQPVAVNEAFRAADEDFSKRNEVRRYAYSSGERGLSPWGASTQAPFDVLNVGYEGKFGAMQTMFLNVELRRPNLFLENLTVEYKEPAPTMGYYQPYESYGARYIALTGGDNIQTAVPGAAAPAVSSGEAMR
jgi:hypothetical protein